MTPNVSVNKSTWCYVLNSLVIWLLLLKTVFKILASLMENKLRLTCSVVTVLALVSLTKKRFGHYAILKNLSIGSPRALEAFGLETQVKSHIFEKLKDVVTQLIKNVKKLRSWQLSKRHEIQCKIFLCIKCIKTWLIERQQFDWSVLWS